MTIPNNSTTDSTTVATKGNEKTTVDETNACIQNHNIEKEFKDQFLPSSLYASTPPQNPRPSTPDAKPRPTFTLKERDDDKASLLFSPTTTNGFNSNNSTPVSLAFSAASRRSSTSSFYSCDEESDCLNSGHEYFKVQNRQGSSRGEVVSPTGRGRTVTRDEFVSSQDSTSSWVLGSDDGYGEITSCCTTLKVEGRDEDGEEGREEEEQDPEYHKSILQLCCENPPSHPSQSVTGNENTASAPLFCCNVVRNLGLKNSQTNLLLDTFIKASISGLTPLKTWTEIDILRISHILVLTHKPAPKNLPVTFAASPIRYFAYFKSTSQYTELTPDVFSAYAEEYTDIVIFPCITCPIHKGAFSIARYKRYEKTSIRYGTTTALSATEVARTKMRVRAEKMVYGAQDEIKEVLRRRLISLGEGRFGEVGDMDRIFGEGDLRWESAGLFALRNGVSI